MTVWAFIVVGLLWASLGISILAGVVRSFFKSRQHVSGSGVYTVPTGGFYAVKSSISTSPTVTLPKKNGLKKARRRLKKLKSKRK